MKHAYPPGLFVYFSGHLTRSMDMRKLADARLTRPRTLKYHLLILILFCHLFRYFFMFHTKKKSHSFCRYFLFFQSDLHSQAIVTYLFLCSENVVYRTFSLRLFNPGIHDQNQPVLKKFSLHCLQYRLLISVLIISYPIYIYLVYLLREQSG